MTVFSIPSKITAIGIPKKNPLIAETDATATVIFLLRVAYDSFSSRHGSTAYFINSWNTLWIMFGVGVVLLFRGRLIYDWCDNIVMQKLVIFYRDGSIEYLVWCMLTMCSINYCWFSFFFERWFWQKEKNICGGKKGRRQLLGVQTKPIEKHWLYS